MVDKDKKFRVIFKLLSKLSSSSKVGIFGVFVLFGVIFYKVYILLVILLKLSV